MRGAAALLLAALALAPAARAAPATGPRLAEEAVGRIARSNEWLRLLHYHRRFPWWNLKSEVDGPGFFLAPGGATDPEAELRADLEAFASGDMKVSRLKIHPQCAFPARYHYLKEELGPGALGIRDVPCPELDEYRGLINARSTTLVFSSAYPGSPASMFGHTFLRFNARKDPGAASMDLLDYGLNYAAVVPPDENSFLYAYMGVMGGYPGEFFGGPYYIKVREYVDGESRDLWEYDLALDERQTLRLIEHAWEIQTNSWFYYYFGTANCSYQLMAMLEVARPDWDLTGHFIHVIPAETIKTITGIPGAVTAVRFRPSMRKRVLASVDALSSSQRAAFDGLVGGARPAASVTDPAPLDAAIEYVHYRKEQAAGNLGEGERKLLREALLQRSRIPAAPDQSLDPVSAPPQGESSRLEDTRPESGHFPYRIGVSGGLMAQAASTGSLGFTDLNLKMAYHDLMNDDRGYSRFSEIDFPNITLRYRPAGNRLSIEQLELASLTSLSPVNVLDHKLSWHAQGDYYSAKDYGCIDCHLLRGEAAVGGAVSALSERAIFYSLLHGYVEGGESLAGTIRGGPKLELSTIVNPLAPYKSRLSVSAVTDLFQASRSWVYYRAEWDESLSLSRHWELRSSVFGLFHPSGFGGDDYSEAKLTINCYL